MVLNPVNMTHKLLGKAAVLGASLVAAKQYLT